MRNNKGQFVKGNVPWIKGRKGTHNSPCTEFKKGVPNNVLKDNPNWSGGKVVNSNGYVMIKNTYHPHADKQGYVLEHRLVMEKHLGRQLNPKEVVHHINEDKRDNRIENLQLMESLSAHIKEHNERTCQNKEVRGITWELDI